MVSETSTQIASFLARLEAHKSESVFNPWAENCAHSDDVGSCVIRATNLKRILVACASAERVDVWVGRDLGWRGGRRTGVPLVDEVTLNEYGISIEVDCLAKATIDKVMKERTATEIHTARKRIAKKIFFWNVFPYHPHDKGKPRSNRMHNREERRLGLEFLSDLIAILPVDNLVAIGNDAGKAIEDLGQKFWTVRHPSYGGQRDFHSQIGNIYELTGDEIPQRDLFDLLPV